VKILFLDFDGVLHPLSAGETLNPMDPISGAVNNPSMFCYTQHLADILAPYDDVGIVVHSSWRLFAFDKDIRLLLGPLGKYFLGVTPRAERYESIRWIVQQNKITDYRILDDAPSEFPDDLPELIVCDSALGINDGAITKQLRNWLDE
jgi:hypothetical protein